MESDGYFTMDNFNIKLLINILRLFINLKLINSLFIIIIKQ